jgi:hypothetical protein
MSDLVRYRYNTMADQTPGGEWKWRVILEREGKFEEVLVKQLLVNVPSFSREDEMPVVGRNYHMAYYGVFRLESGVGIVDAAKPATGDEAAIGDDPESRGDPYTGSPK